MHNVGGIVMKVMICSEKKSLTERPGGEEFNFFGKENIAKLESMFDEVVWNETGRKFTEEELIEKIADCDAVITCWHSNYFSEEVLKHAPKLKIIAHLAGSLAPFVGPEVYDRGIMVCGANDMEFAESVAEGALTSMLIKLRRYDEIARGLRDKKKAGWREIPLLRGLFDRTVGIVSFGAIAEYLVGLLQPFHCKIKVYSRRPLPEETLNKYKMEQVSLEEIFSTCDVISLHTAWNAHTEKMVSRDLIKSMKDDAILVNTARGKIIDQEALEEELKTGRISAALDVFWTEPLPEDNPMYDLDNVFITDHRGGPTHDRYRVIASNMLDDVYNYLTKGIVPKSEIKREKALSMTLR